MKRLVAIIILTNNKLALALCMHILKTLHLKVKKHVIFFLPITVVNETPMVRGLAADNSNMQSVLMRNMETTYI